MVSTHWMCSEGGQLCSLQTSRKEEEGVCRGGRGLGVLSPGRRETLTCPVAPHPPPCAHLPSYGRVYAAADPYHHTIGPAATYSIGTMVRRPRPG